MEKKGAESTYRFRIGVPLEVVLQGQRMNREDFFAWAWKQFTGAGLLGVHEGTLLTAEAAQAGLETESWTVDAAEAPRERDWIGHRKMADAEFYFSTRPGAEAALKRLSAIAGLVPGTIEEQPPEDWDAQWKASFLASPDGVKIAPCWRIHPPWVDSAVEGAKSADVVLKINPGAGFGTGTHETTQLCLKAIAECAGPARDGLRGQPVLDFGSGSGILSIGAALLGGRVDAVEIDPLAIDNALENARLNGVDGGVKFYLRFADAPGGAAGPYRLVIANILRPVLLEFAPELVRRLAPGGTLILSGLIETDVPSVAARFSELLGGLKPKHGEAAEWRSLVWRRE